MGAGHDHGASAAHAGGQHRARLWWAGALLAAFMVVEAVAALATGSLALLSDAGHMFTDVLGIGMALAAISAAKRAGRDPQRTFGLYRLEVLAALGNAVLLAGVTGYVVIEAARRLTDPPDVLAGPMLAVAVVGLLVNCLVFWILHRGDQSHVNIKGATLHVLGDLLGSVAAIVAALVIHFTGWMPIDPILSVLVCLLILRSAWSLLRNAFDILMEAVPPDIDIATVRAHLRQTVPGVADVDHVHVWSITSGKVLATLELTLADEAHAVRVVPAVKRALAERFSIGHATVEVVHTPQAQCALERRGRHTHHHHDHDHAHDGPHGPERAR